jgi:hypothetical protein
MHGAQYDEQPEACEALRKRHRFSLDSKRRHCSGALAIYDLIESTSSPCFIGSSPTVLSSKRQSMDEMPFKRPLTDEVIPRPSHRYTFPVPSVAEKCYSSKFCPERQSLFY